MDEFALIRRYFQPLQRDDSSVCVGMGDDCALVTPPPGQQLVISTDTLVEGTHFLPGSPAQELAWRLLGASISDLAAMGAQPGWLTLSLTLPQADPHWLAQFAQGLSAALDCYNITLVGGDTTRGPLSLTAQVQGWLPAGSALLRSKAAVDDYICVTGTLGDSRAGLALLSAPDDQRVSEPDRTYLLNRFYRPQPRLATGQLLRAFASACIDLSDGLQGDLAHILSASGVGARIDSALLPRSAALQRWPDQQHALRWALAGGEDFELCFTVSPKRWPALAAQLAEHPVAVTRIGYITDVPGLWLQQHGQWQPMEAGGYNHFNRQDNR